MQQITSKTEAKKFSNALLDEIRARVLVSDVVGRKALLKSNGREFTGLCPFHKEKSPSFTVSDEKGFYHCFGCGAHGDIIKFLMETEGLTFTDTVEMFTNECSFDVKSFEQKHAENEAKKITEKAAIVRKEYIKCFNKYIQRPSCNVFHLLLILSGENIDDEGYFQYCTDDYCEHVVGRALEYFYTSAFHIDDAPIARPGTQYDGLDALVRPKIFIQWCIDSGAPISDDIKLLTLEVLGNKAIIAESAYTTPYLELMKAAIAAHSIANDNQGKVDFLKDWFKENGKKAGLVISDRQASTMASFIRLPESAKGGNRPAKK